MNKAIKRDRPRNSRSLRATENVLRDIGLPDAEVVAAKLGLAVHINTTLARRRAKRGAASKYLGITTSELSLIRTYKADQLLLDKLLTVLNALNRDIEIIVHTKPKLRRKGRITLLAA